MKAVFPGSFDPVTLGHINLIRRAAKAFDELTVGILINASKTPMFTMEEREAMLREAVGDLPNLTIRSFSGLNADFAREEGASFIVRGIRNASDLDYEMQLANGNRAIAPEIDTVFLFPDTEVSFVSSGTAKEIAYYGGDISRYVPSFVENKIKEKLTERKSEQDRADHCGN